MAFKIHKSDWVARVEWNRPKVNACDHQTFLDLKKIFDDIKNDGTVRVVLFYSANPKIFTAGLDLKSVSFDMFGNDDPARDAIQFMNGVIKPWQEAITSIEECRVMIYDS